MFFLARCLHSLEEKHNKQNIILEQNCSVLVSCLPPAPLSTKCGSASSPPSASWASPAEIL